MQFQLNHLRNPIKWIIKLLWSISHVLYSNSRKIIIKLRQFGVYLGQKTLSILVLLGLFASLGIICAGILPSPQNFEGSLLVKELSFTYVDEDDKLFLKDIKEIPKIEGNGSQTLMLNGIFSSALDTDLNKKLLQYKSLKIQLPYGKSSQWIANPYTPNANSKLKIIGLTFHHNIDVNRIIYKPYKRHLSLSIADKDEKNNEVGQLSLDLGEDPIKLTFTNYKIEELGLGGEDSTPLELIFKPDNNQINLSLSKLSNLSIFLPDPNKISYEDWFWGSSAVKNVHFETSKQAESVIDKISKSTIIKGQIRMGEQELKIEQNQFLVIGKPGIDCLIHLEVIPPQPAQKLNFQIAGENLELSPPPEGLEVRFRGKSTQIQTGLDRSLPVRTLRASFLTNFFSNDVVITIVSLLAATFISLFTWIVNDFISWLSTNSKSATNP